MLAEPLRVVSSCELALEEPEPVFVSARGATRKLDRTGSLSSIMVAAKINCEVPWTLILLADAGVAAISATGCSHLPADQLIRLENPSQAPLVPASIYRAVRSIDPVDRSKLCVRSSRLKLLMRKGQEQRLNVDVVEGFSCVLCS